MSTYDHIRCPLCGCAWSEHPPDCLRHDYRPGASPLPAPTPSPPPDQQADSLAEVTRLRAALDRIEREAVVPLGGASLGQWEWAVGQVCGIPHTTRDEAVAAFRKRFGLAEGKD